MNDSGYLDTEQAAAHLNMRPKTLARYRVSGGGPVYHLLGRLVRYLREDLDEWARGRRRASTSDDGTALSGPKGLDPDGPGTGAAP